MLYSKERLLQDQEAAGIEQWERKMRSPNASLLYNQKLAREWEYLTEEYKNHYQVGLLKHFERQLLTISNII